MKLRSRSSLTSRWQDALVLVAISLPGISLATEVEDERRARLEKMTPLEKEELRRNLQRLEQLTSEEQRKLRLLEQQLADDPNEVRLRTVMLRYHEWLRALPSAMRGELLALSPEERVPKIKAMLEQQKTDQLRELAKDSLTPEDVEQVRSWLHDMILRRRDDLLKQLPEAARERLAGSKDPQRFIFEWFAHNRWDRNKNPIPITDALNIQEGDRRRLLEKMSEQALAVYRQAGTDDQYQQTVIQNWVFASPFRRRPPSKEELQVFLQRLPPDVRDRIENLPPEQMQQELTRILHDFMRRRGPEGMGPPGSKGPPGGSGERSKGRLGEPRSGPSGARPEPLKPNQAPADNESAGA